MPIRRIQDDEVHMSSLAVSTYESKQDMLQVHASDIKGLNTTILPPYAIDDDSRSAATTGTPVSPSRSHQNSRNEGSPVDTLDPAVRVTGDMCRKESENISPAMH